MVLPLSFSFLGCARLQLALAERREKKGYGEQALKSYLWVSNHYPRHPLAPRALFQAGLLCSRKLGDDLLARDLLQRVMDRYGDHPMDLADASLIAAAEALGTQRVFTLDRPDFLTYRIRRGHRHVAVQIVR